MAQIRPEYDLIVIGGGCAGLSLARLLIKQNSELHVLIVEHRAVYSDDRTWCFWAKQDHPLRDLETKSWGAWQFSTVDMSACLHRPDNGLAYRCIKSISFYQRVQREIEHSSFISLMMPVRVKDCRQDTDFVTVVTDQGEFCSRWVIDTRQRPDSATQNRFGQHFLGIEIESDQDIFDDHVARIMSDMQQDDYGFRFTYLLPFSKRHALIEETRFTKGIPKERLETDLQQTLVKQMRGIKFQERRREKGFIPMSCDAKPPVNNSHIIHAGVAAGAARPSTGYAFLRIQSWASQCALSLSQEGIPQHQKQDPTWMQWADKLFLKVIEDPYTDKPETFLRLARGMCPNHFVRFLSADAQIIDLARAIYALPKKPFLAGLGSISKIKRASR